MNHATWHGTEDRANPFAQVNRSESFKKDFIVDLDILQVQDNQVMQQDVWYQNVSQMPFVNLPWTLEDFRTSDPYYP